MWVGISRSDWAQYPLVMALKSKYHSNAEIALEYKWVKLTNGSHLKQ